MEDLDLPGEAEIERHLKEQRAQFVEVRSAEFASLLAALPPRKYNPLRLCERDDVIFGHRLFLNRELASKQVRAELARGRNVFQFVTALAATQGFRKNSYRHSWVAAMSPGTMSPISHRLCLHCDPESEQLYEAHVGKKTRAS